MGRGPNKEGAECGEGRMQGRGGGEGVRMQGEGQHAGAGGGGSKMGSSVQRQRGSACHAEALRVEPCVMHEHR